MLFIGYLTASHMRLAGRHESLVILLSLLCTCTYGLQVDFSQLKQLRRPYIIDKRDGTTCTGNLCFSSAIFIVVNLNSDNSKTMALIMGSGNRK
ncbi:hypothetical protein ACJMK2_038180 [Sinanodonta woodiana]|uniref:Secreted protein n=1 Tax=Sinanodonta woodiana TaxID=1069815 RepID=A0ABD3WMP2_SINWO